jgi:hypothetical protein
MAKPGEIREAPGSTIFKRSEASLENCNFDKRARAQAK